MHANMRTVNTPGTRHRRGIAGRSRLNSLDLMKSSLAPTVAFSLLLIFVIRSAGAEPAAPQTPPPGLPYANRRVGHIEVSRSPDFDVVADAGRKRLHLVWRDGGTIKHTFSTNGGDTWTQPAVAVETGAAGGPRVAVDSVGRLHLAYGATKAGARHARIDGRTFYTALHDGSWSTPIEALVPTSLTYDFQIVGPRVAVDGRDHVHVIGWVLANSDDWQRDSRCAYARKPAGGGPFEPTLLFSYGKDGDGGARHGALATDPAGDVHIFYASYNRNARPPLKPATTTHFTRRKDGQWGAKVDLFCSTATDFGMSATVDAHGVVHIAGQDASAWSRSKNPDALIYWSYFNNAGEGGELKPVHRVDDNWEYGADLLLAPNGDIWLSRGNWQQDGPFPWLGRYVRLDSATGRWTEPESLSAPGFKNADGKYGQVPKFAFHEGRVHLFYAEQAPGGPFKFQQRTFSPVSVRPR